MRLPRYSRRDNNNMADKPDKARRRRRPSVVGGDETTSGLGGSILMTVVGSCPLLDNHLPARCGLADRCGLDDDLLLLRVLEIPLRRRLVAQPCMAAITSVCCARNASPSFWVQSSFSFIIVSTSGKTAKDFTLDPRSAPAAHLLAPCPSASGSLDPAIGSNDFQG